MFKAVEKLESDLNKQFISSRRTKQETQSENGLGLQGECFKQRKQYTQIPMEQWKQNHVSIVLADQHI